MSRTTFVLLPPSESKEPGGRLGAPPGLFDEVLASPRARVLHALASALAMASPEEASRLLKVRGPLLERALDANRRLIDGTAPLLPAWQRFDGVVWSHLEPASLTPRQRQRILIPSAIYGLSTGADAVADFRLTMKASIADLGNIARFWRPTLCEVLVGMTGAQLVSFLPKEHAAAIGTSTGLSKRLVTVTFLRHDGDGVAGHDAKAVKGIIARRVLDEGLEAVEGFRWKGWRGSIHRGRYEVVAPRTVQR